MSAQIGINIFINVDLLMLDLSLKAIGRMFAQMFLPSLSRDDDGRQCALLPAACQSLYDKRGKHTCSLEVL